MDNESKRKGIHILNGFWAFIIPFLPRIIAIFIVLVALIFVFILARPNSPFGSFFRKAFSAMARSDDWDRGFLIGPSIYVCMVLILIIFVDYRIAGALFAILAFGDGFATIFGRKYGKHKLANNKSLEGSLAFFTFSFVSSLGVFLLINSFHNPGAGLILIGSFILPIDLNINIITLILIFLIINFILTIIELFTSDYINDNFIIPILGFVLFYFILNSVITFQIHV